MKINIKKDENHFSNDFYAMDAFPFWKHHIKNATVSVKIFSPYVDHTINDLFALIPKNINVVKKIITKIDGDSFFERGYQISALIEAINSGCEILHLSDLHSKVLIVDNGVVSVGSQNFTYRGRKNKETTILLSNSIDNSDLLNELLFWESNSINISLDLLKSIQEFENINLPELKKIKKIYNDGIDSLLTKHIEKETNDEFIEQLISQSSIRFAKESVFLSKQVIYSYDKYRSLVCRDTDDLTSWIKKDKNGKKQPFELKWLYFYPAFNVLTHQIAFLRIAQTRITFVRYQAKFLKEFIIGNLLFDIEFRFLKKNAKHANIKIKLSNELLGNVFLWYYFNGKLFKLRRQKYTSDKLKMLITIEFLSNQNNQDKFFCEYFQAFRYTEQLDFEDKGIDKFAKEYYYWANIIEFQGVPIVILRK